jgi:CBS domain containing-hemolysin-like protein
MQTPLALQLVAVVFLVAANAFFVAAEFVLVSVRPTRLRQLEQEGHAVARVALRLQERIDGVLSATQLGITVASLGLGWLGENAIAQLLLAVFSGWSHGPRLALAHSIAIAVAFLLLTMMHVVLGEVVPKNVALGTAGERLALLVSPPIELFVKVTRPLLVVLNFFAFRLSRLFGAKPTSHVHVHSAEELKMLVSAGIESGLLDESLEAMIHGLLDLSKIMVREIMVPRPDIVSISIDTPFEKLLRVFTRHQHSRLPVYEGTPENFVGLVHVKDVFRTWVERYAAQKEGAQLPLFRLRNHIRKVLIVPETVGLDDLLAQFRARRQHLALVVDEFGSIAGLATIVDLLERVLGEFAEPHDRQAVQAAGAAGSVLEGSTHIHEVQEQYEIEMPREAGFETLAGFLMKTLGRIPRTGDVVAYNGWKFTVQEMDGHRVALVRLEPIQPLSH